MVENQQILGTKGKKVRTFGAPELDDGVDEALVEVGRPSEPRLRVRREYQAGAVCRERVGVGGGCGRELLRMILGPSGAHQSSESGDHDARKSIEDLIGRES
ncbi:hypothetical protein BHE74_00053243 [Ensete ventricosum]|nr:hypothetical protein BHE74_00053243 [Ensete ventricosum]